MHALNLILIFVCAMAATAQTPGAQELVSNTSVSNATLPHLSLLLPPLNRAVTPGLAWVYPSSTNDLGARSMSCECFDPADQCCMPTSKLVAPYCMPTGSTCCGNTFCVAGETCCGDFCCATNTTCNLNIYTSGCCPIGSICQNLMTCYDAASPNCTNTITPAQQCCPANMPYCRDFAPNGLGCYASSVVGKVSTMSGMGWGTSAAPTSAILGLETTQTTTSEGNLMTTSTKASIKTVTVSVVSNSSGGMSLAFPGLTKAVNGTCESTTYILEYPSSDIAQSKPTSEALHTEETSMIIVTGPEIYSTVYSTTTSAATPSSTSSASTSSGSTSKSPLCFNTDLQTPAPCPSSVTATNSIATSSALPATTTASSQANSMKSLPASAYTLLVIIYILSGIVFLAGLVYASLWLISWVRRDNDVFARDVQDVLGVPAQSPPIEVVQGSGRRLSSASILGREISIVRETGRVYKSPMIIDKSTISVVEGSGHWVEGFSEKDPSCMTYTNYGNTPGSAPTTVAMHNTSEKPRLANENFNIDEVDAVMARNRDRELAARFPEVQDADAEETGAQSVGKEMAQENSTSSLGHIFLGERANC